MLDFEPSIALHVPLKMLCFLPPRSEFLVSVSECKEGQRLLSAASRAHPKSGAREAFLKHNQTLPSMQRSQ